MGMSSGGRRGGAISDINVTPLVDVMLVLLIIFMVTAPLITQGVEVALPKTKAQPLAGDETKVVLSITKDKQIFIGNSDKSPIPLAQLEEKLKFNAKLQKDKELFLHADRSLEYGFVVDIMAIIKRSGIESLGMVTDPVEPTAPKK